MSLTVAGCGELEYYGYGVWNYSSSHYYVRLTSDNSVVADTNVPPMAAVYGGTYRQPGQVAVYDQTCSTQLATFAFPSGTSLFDLVMSATGVISVPDAPLGRPEAEDPSLGESEPATSGCMALP